jgi:hypothetical protein
VNRIAFLFARSPLRAANIVAAEEMKEAMGIAGEIRGFVRSA